LATSRSSNDAARLADPRWLRKCLLVLLLSLGTPLWVPTTASAAPCGESAIASIYGSGNVVTVAGQAGRGCNQHEATPAGGNLGPYFTHVIACSSNRQAAAAGICSATPCSASGQFFALRTLHNPNGTTTPAGFQCVTLTQATPTPGLTTAQVFAAIRRVKLPGGQIGAVPEVRGLANLESFFYLHGATQPPVDLQVGGQVVHEIGRAHV